MLKKTALLLMTNKNNDLSVSNSTKDMNYL